MDACESLLVLSLVPRVPLIGNRQDAYRYLAYTSTTTIVFILFLHVFLQAAFYTRLSVPLREKGGRFWPQPRTGTTNSHRIPPPFNSQVVIGRIGSLTFEDLDEDDTHMGTRDIEAAVNAHRFGKFRGKVENLRVGSLLTPGHAMTKDDWFYRKVVLVTSLGSSSWANTEGVVINAPLSRAEEIEARKRLRLVDPHDVVGKTRNKLDISRVWLGVGGPVTDSDEWYHVHDIDMINGAIRLSHRVFFGGNVGEVLEKIGTRGRMKLLFGRAVWAPGQLEYEIMRGGWRIRNGTHELVFPK